MTCVVSQASIFIDLFHKDSRYFVSSEKCNVWSPQKLYIAGHFFSHASLLIVTSSNSSRSFQFKNIETWIFLKRKSDHILQRKFMIFFWIFDRGYKDDINHICDCEKSFFLLETGMISSLEYFEKFINLSVEKYRIFPLLVLYWFFVYGLFYFLDDYSREIINNWIKLSNSLIPLF